VVGGRRRGGDRGWWWRPAVGWGGENARAEEDNGNVLTRDYGARSPQIWMEKGKRTGREAQAPLINVGRGCGGRRKRRQRRRTIAGCGGGTGSTSTRADSGHWGRRRWRRHQSQPGDVGGVAPPRFTLPATSIGSVEEDRMGVGSTRKYVEGVLRLMLSGEGLRVGASIN
jgi:hypothetical protein